MTIAMIEPMAAIGNLDEIVAVDGIGVFFVARHDLAKDFGLPDGKRSPEIELDNAVSVVAQGAQLVLLSLSEVLTLDAACLLERSGPGRTRPENR